MTTVVVPLSTATAASFAPTVKAVVAYAGNAFYGRAVYGVATYNTPQTVADGGAPIPVIRITITISTGTGSFYGSAVYGVATYVGEAAIRAVFPSPTVQLIVLAPHLTATGEAFPVAAYVKVVAMRSPTMTAGYYFDVFGLITSMWVDNQGAGDIFVEFEHDDGRTWNGEFEPGGESAVDVSSGEMYVYFDVENESAYLNLASISMRDPA